MANEYAYYWWIMKGGHFSRTFTGTVNHGPFLNMDVDEDDKELCITCTNFECEITDRDSVLGCDEWEGKS